MRPTGAILLVPAEGWWEAFGLTYRPAASLSAFGLSFLAFGLSFSAFSLWDPQYFCPQKQLSMSFLDLPDHFQQKNFFFIFGQPPPRKKIFTRERQIFFFSQNQLSMTFLALPDHFQQKNFFFQFWTQWPLNFSFPGGVGGSKKNFSENFSKIDADVSHDPTKIPRKFQPDWARNLGGVVGHTHTHTHIHTHKDRQNFSSIILWFQMAKYTPHPSAALDSDPL